MANIVWLPPVKSSGTPSVTLMDAMYSLVSWNRIERLLVNECHYMDSLSYEWIEKVINHYSLSSVLLRKHRTTKHQQAKLVRLLSEYKNSRNSIDHVTVLARELEPFTQYGKDGSRVRNDLRVASIFMWYFNKLDIVQHSIDAKHGLEYLLEIDNRIPEQDELESEIACDAEFEIEMDEEEGIEFGFELEIPLDLHAYFDFHQCWMDMYIEHAAEVKITCDNLFQLCDYESMAEGDDYHCLHNEWFHRHVFSMWLSYLGVSNLK